MKLKVIIPWVLVYLLILTGVMAYIGVSDRLSEPVVLQYVISADYSGPITLVKLPSKFRFVSVTGTFDRVGARYSQEFGSQSVGIFYRTIKEAEETSEGSIASMVSVNDLLESRNFDIKKEIVLNGVRWQLRVEKGKDMYAFAEFGQWRVVVRSKADWTESSAVEFLSGIEWSDDAFKTPEAHASGTP